MRRAGTLVSRFVPASGRESDRGIVHSSTPTPSLLTALACLVVALGWTVACSSTAPSSVVTNPSVSIVGNGNGRLTAVGQTSQLTAIATMADRSTKDVTSVAQWSTVPWTCSTNVATVSPTGLVSAVGFGKTDIRAVFTPAGGRPIGSQFTLTVLPEGTYILCGRVTEAGMFPLAGARVELVGGPDSGRTGLTNSDGRYAFDGVSGVSEVRASKDGYVTATQTVTGNTELVNIALTASVPYASMGGAYTLTFKASSSCELPDDVMSRTYSVGIDQERAAVLTVVLANGQFVTLVEGDGSRVTLNKFVGHVYGNMVTFTLTDPSTDWYFDSAVMDKLADQRYLSFAGTAQATPTVSGISATLAGIVRVTTCPGSGLFSDQDCNATPPIATCSAPDHQLIFTRTTDAASYKRFPAGR